MNSGDFLLGLAHSSFAAAILALLVFALQGVFRKQLTPHWHSMLWLLVVARLLPLSVNSDVSLFNVFPAWARTSPAPSVPTTTATNQSGNLIALIGADASPTSQPLDSASPHPVSIYARWHLLLLLMWLAGVIIAATYVLIHSNRLARSLIPLRPVTANDIHELLLECCRTMGVRRPPVLRETHALQTPALYGFFRPTLLLPEGFTRTFSQSELRFVFLHELAHFRRFDLPLNGLMTLLQIIHWFNPLVWLAFSRWRLDREMACDAAVIAASGKQSAQAYGHTLIHVLERYSTPAYSHQSLLQIAGSKTEIQQRLAMINSFKPTRRKALAIALVAILGSLGLTDAQVESQPIIPAPATPGSNPVPTDATSWRSDQPTRNPDGRRIAMTDVDRVIVDVITDRFEGDRSRFLRHLRADSKTIRMYRNEIETKLVNGEIALPPNSGSILVAEGEEEIHLRLIQLTRAPAEDDASLLARATLLTQKLSTGEAFADLAKDYSDDFRRARGGDWGWLKRTDLRDPFTAIAFQLKPGEASAPILLPEACFIIYVEDRRPDHPVERP